MKNIFNNILLSGTLLGVLSISCKKSPVDPTPITPVEDTIAPTILTTNPIQNGMYMVDSNGIVKKPIKIQAEIADNDQIHSISVSLRYVNKDSIVMNFHKHTHEATYSLDTTYKNTNPLPLVLDHQNHELIIRVEDHSGNITSDTTEFFIHYMG